MPQNKIWPIDIYQQMVTNDVIDIIVAETNRYAEQVIEFETATRSSRLKTWHQQIERK